MIIQPAFWKSKICLFPIAARKTMSEKKMELPQGLQNHLAQASSTEGKQKNRNVGGKKHEVPRRFDYRKGLGFEPPRKIKRETWLLGEAQ